MAELIRFSDYVIKQIQERNFDGVCFWGFTASDWYGLSSPGVYAGKGTAPWINNFHGGPNYHSVDSWHLYSYTKTRWFKSYELPVLYRAGKQLDRLSEQEQRNLLEALNEGLDYFRNVVIPRHKLEQDDIHEKRHWIESD